MPKLVDHASRREQIVEAVWRIVAREGFAALTMRQLADELGLANGALARYFPNKSAILEAAFSRAFHATNRRALAASGSRHGLSALRALCLEIMPLDEERLDEARVVIGFWDHAAADDHLRSLFDEAMAQWRSDLLWHMRVGQQKGEVRSDLDIETTIELFMTTLTGLQINAVFSPACATPERQLRLLDQLLLGLRDVGRELG